MMITCRRHILSFFKIGLIPFYCTRPQGLAGVIPKTIAHIKIHVSLADLQLVVNIVGEVD